jgi:hypothetical protein
MAYSSGVGTKNRFREEGTPQRRDTRAALTPPPTSTLEMVTTTPRGHLRRLLASYYWASTAECTQKVYNAAENRRLQDFICSTNSSLDCYREFESTANCGEACLQCRSKTASSNPGLQDELKARRLQGVRFERSLRRSIHHNLRRSLIAARVPTGAEDKA